MFFHVYADLVMLSKSNDLKKSVLDMNQHYLEVKLMPSNDFCDYPLPNLHQVARSNLVEVKKNKTLQWLHNLSDDHQLKVIDLAVESRQIVQKECSEADDSIEIS